MVKTTCQKSALVLLSLFSLWLGACKKDDEKPVTETELITTVRLTFTNPVSGVSSTFNWKDADGDGGQAPVADQINLSQLITYTVSVSVLDESKNPAEDITEEIEAEKDEHLFVFTPSGISGFTMTATDVDSQGKPVGLTATAVSTNPGTGSLRVVLKHEPDKNAADPGATGDTDVEATFPVVIQ